MANQATGRPWKREELLSAIALYLETPFGRIHVRNPDIIELAQKLDRTPGSVGLKLANFSAIDPSLDRKGARNYSKLDKQVWDEVFSNWNLILSEVDNSTKTQTQNVNESVSPWPFPENIPEGLTVTRLVETRQNQNVFRKMILASYNEKCCVTGLKTKDLLLASHIVPWSEDAENRLNPMNGLCLNALHDKAFDRGLITVDESFHLVVSNRLEHSSKGADMIWKYHGQPVNLPGRFRPGQKFLEYHRENVFTG